MKKITAISVVSLLLLASCGGKGKDAASMDYGLEEANEVISYYNTSIDITKKMVDMGEISKIIDYMQKNGKTLVAPVVIRTPVSATDTTALLNPGDCFPSSAADSLKMYYRRFFDVSKRLYANYDTYRDYIKAEDYKDDNYAKGNEICKEEKELAEQIPGLRSQIYALLTPYADKAEEATLMDNPLKDHILAGKALIFEIEKTLELYSPKAKKEDLQAAYDAVNAKKEAASKLEKKADFQSEMSNYDNLLKYVDKFLGELRKQLRDGKFTEDGYNDLVSEYNDVISRYNSFIN